jgi:hypothetical protein
MSVASAMAAWFPGQTVVREQDLALIRGSIRKSQVARPNRSSFISATGVYVMDCIELVHTGLSTEEK